MMEQGNKKQVLLHKLSNIEPLPAIIEQLTALLDEENPDIRQIASVLETDIGMTTRLLRIANSPFFGFQRQVSSVKSAIVMLGLTELKNLIMSFVVVKQFDKLGTWDVIDQDCFWQYSIAVSGLSSGLASLTGNDGLKNDAFTLGIIHKLGTCVLAHSFPADYKLIQQSESVLEDLEHKQFAFDHHEAGWHICQHWNLPEEYALAVAGHQANISPQDLAGTTTLAAILGLSSSLVPLLGYGDRRFIVLPNLMKSLEKLAISKAAFLAVWQQLPEQLSAMLHQDDGDGQTSQQGVNVDLASSLSESNLAVYFELFKEGFITHRDDAVESKKCVLYYDEHETMNSVKEGLTFNISPYIANVKGKKAINWVAMRQEIYASLQETL